MAGKVGGRYSSKEQEAYYQPIRLKIAKRPQSWGRHYSSYTYYDVVQWNTATHMIETSWPRPTPDWDDMGIERRFDTLKAATVFAKAYAQSSGLPFNLKTDVGENILDLTEGPERACIICEGQLGRGWDADVCTACRADMALGRQRREGTVRTLIKTHELLDADYISGCREISNSLIMCLMRIARVQVSLDCSSIYAPSGPTDEVLRSTARRRTDIQQSQYVVHFTPSVVAAIREVISLVLEYGRLWHKRGHENGSSLLRRLADGEIHPNEFAARRDAVIGQR